MSEQDLPIEALEAEEGGEPEATANAASTEEGGPEGEVEDADF